MRDDFLPLARPSMTPKEIEAAAAVLRSGHLTTGPKAGQFESDMAQYIGSGVSAAALNSCTGALYLSLVAHGIGKGDEVIVPTWTFAATAHVVVWTGATPVLCDVEPESLNIDVAAAQKLITKRTKAVMPVHYAGYPCDMDGLGTLAKTHKLIIIEDAAHAMGAEYKGKKIGASGNAVAFSFYATKNLACGEGGMVVSTDKAFIERIRRLGYFGINKEAFKRYTKAGSWYYEIEDLGYKYNMDDIHAAIGIAQLARLEAMNERRRAIAKMYKAGLDKKIKFTKDDGLNRHAYHLFPIMVPREIIARDTLMRTLKERNIGTSVHFIPLHRHPYYKRSASGRAFPAADKAYEDIISIPLFPDMSDDDVRYVVENINDILKKERLSCC